MELRNKKRPRKSYFQSDDEDEPNYQPKNPLENLAEVLNLLIIDDWLTHTQQLICRLVCKDWNGKISSVLSETSSFSLASMESNTVVLDSIVPWKGLKIYDMGSSVLPTVFKNSITSLELEMSSGARFIDYIELTTEFPKLTNLCINIDDAEPEHAATPIEKRVAKLNFEQVVRNLKNLTVEFPFNKYRTLNNFLDHFDAENIVLKELYILERWSEDTDCETASIDDNQNLMLHVRRVISKSSRTLKLLHLDFHSKSICSLLFTKLVKTICQDKHLKLDSILILSGQFLKLGFDEETDGGSADFQIYLKFLEIQRSRGEIKCISLPWIPNKDPWQAMSKKLSKNLEIAAIVRKNHITPDFPTKFKKLDYMSIVSNEMYTFNGPCPSVQRLWIYFTRNDHLPLEEEKERRIYSLATALVNVVNLRIIPIDNLCTPLFEMDIQLIIQNFKLLQTLEIYCGEHLTDYAVTGIDENYSRSLLRTKRLYNCPEISNDKMLGFSLSSLKFLKKLGLLGTNISDVGIYYGLRFGPSLEHMTFGSVSDEVSEWGLEWLGKGSPKLESFEGTFKDTQISATDGEKILKEQLPLLKSTKKLKLYIQETVDANSL